LVAGCSSDTASDDAVSSAAAAEAGGEGLPEEVLGTFIDGRDGSHFTFYAAADDFCTEEVDTSGSCYAVRDNADTAADPLEHGTATADGAVLQLVLLKDPKADCVGVTNELSWKRTDDALTLTPIKDCHGTRILELSKV
jgi:hypothetical protein